MPEPARGVTARSRRERLLVAGLELLDQFPPDEITVAMVAERAGVARGLVFYYFETKEGFEQAVANRFYRMVREALDTNQQDSPAAAVAADLGIVLDLSEKHPGAMRATSSPRALSFADADASLLNDFAAARILGMLGVSLPCPGLSAIVGSWSLHVVDMALRRSEYPGLSRSDVEAVLMAEIRAAVSAFARLHPEAGLDPAILD